MKIWYKLLLLLCEIIIRTKKISRFTSFHRTRDNHFYTFSREYFPLYIRKKASAILPFLFSFPRAIGFFTAIRIGRKLVLHTAQFANYLQTLFRRDRPHVEFPSVSRDIDFATRFAGGYPQRCTLREINPRMESRWRKHEKSHLLDSMRTYLRSCRLLKIG